MSFWRVLPIMAFPAASGVIMVERIWMSHNIWKIIEDMGADRTSGGGEFSLYYYSS